MLPFELFELVARSSCDGIVIMNDRSLLLFVNQSAAALLGYEPEELLGQPLTVLMPEELRQAHSAGIAEYLRTGNRRLVWNGIELPGLHRSGREIPLEISFAEARFDSQIFFAGFMRDLSERRWSHARLAAQYAVAEILSVGEDETRVLQDILSSAGEHLGFAAGNLWMVEQDGLRWNGSWHTPAIKTDIFDRASRTQKFSRGEGLPGRAWEQEAPAWITTLAGDTNFSRAEAASAAHLQSGLAFPICRGPRVVGVMEYFSTHVRPLEPTLLQILNAISQQISQFLARKYAQDALLTTEAQHRILFENSNDAFGVSVDEHFLYVNQAFATMFGYSHSDDLVGMPIYETLPASQHAAVRAHRERRLAGLPEPMQYEARGLRQDGVDFSTEVRATDYWINGRMYTLAILRDTTRERQAQEVLTQSNAALRRANEDLEQFAYAASHDLQEPLRMITLYSELLTRRHRDTMAPAAQHLLGTITNAARRINELVNDLLSYTNAASIDATPPPVMEIQPVLEEVKNTLQERIVSTETTIFSGALASVRIHRTHLFQLLQNLVSNSIKYHNPGVPPVIRIATRPIAEGRIELSVEDNGIGIEPEYHERIFGIFKRLHSSSVPGTGIGLAICKKIVEYYGGTIRVESDAGEGATFYLTLPAAISAPTSVVTR